MKTTQSTRSLSTIALEISQTWKNPHYSAIPYLYSMASLGSINDNDWHDSGRSTVLYFLSNASTWRGDDAKRIKAELKEMAGVK